MTPHSTLLILALLCATPAAAQLPQAPVQPAPPRVASDTTDSLVRRPPVALGAVRVLAARTSLLPQALTATTIGARAMERTLGSSLAATLATTPGMAVRWQGPGASAPVIRGLSGERVAVLNDGVRTADLASTAPDHGVTIDPLAGSEVELVRGPAALLLGAGAIGGAMDVRSGDIPTDAVGRIMGRVSASGETAAPGGAFSAEVHAPLGGGLVLRARGGARAHHAVRAGAGWDAARLPNSRSDSRNGALGLSRIGDHGMIGLAWRGYRFGYGLPHAPGDEALAVDLAGSRDELLARAEREAPVRGIERVRVDGGVQRYRHDETFSDGTVGTSLGLETLTAQVVARLANHGAWRDGAIGASALARRNDVTGSQALTPTNQGTTFSLFGTQALHAGRVRFPVSLRVDEIRVASDASERFGAGISRRFPILSAAAGIGYEAGGVSLQGTVARTGRAPSAEELFSRAGHTGTGAFEIGDPQLRTEVSTGLDAVLRVERARGRMELSVHRNAVERYTALWPAGRDTVVPDGVGGTKALPLFAVSQRAATLWGMELSAERALGARVRVEGAGDFVRARDAAGAPLPFIPAGRVSGGVRYDDGRRALGASLRRVFRQGAVPDGELRAEGYTLLGADVTLRIPRAGSAHTITLRGENLADALVRDAASRIKAFAPNPGRNFVVTYSVSY